MPLSILVAADQRELREALVEQLSVDGHEVHRAQHSRHAVALLAGCEIGVLILGALEQGAMSLRLLRAGALDARAWPEVPLIRLAAQLH